MRESFIAQYLEEQKRLGAELKVYEQSPKSSKKKNTGSHYEPVKKKTRNRRKKRSNRAPKSIRDIVKAKIGNAAITQQTSFSCALKLLGFSSYAEYLKSPLWMLVRQLVFRTKGCVCFLCKNRADAVHHRRYTGLTLIGSHLQYLSPICHKCHEMIEFDINGEKLPSRDVEEYVTDHLMRDEMASDEVSSEFRSMFI